MPLQKESALFNFAQGVDTLSDPNQLPLGKFISLQNSSFIKSSTGEYAALSKRNGFGSMPALPASIPANSYAYVTTYGGAFTAIGTKIVTLSGNENVWVSNQSTITPLQLSTLPLYRSSTNQSFCDSAISALGTVCTVFGDNILVGSTSALRTVFSYVVNDGSTGQNLVQKSNIITTSTISYSPKVFALGSNFVIAFSAGSASANLQYVPISTSANGTSIGSATIIAANYVPTGSQSSFDGVVASNTLYLSWNTAAGVKMASISSSLAMSSVFSVASQTANIMSVCADRTTSPPTIWSTFVSGSATWYAAATVASASSFSNVLPQLNCSSASSTAVIVNLATAAAASVNQVFLEAVTTYLYDTAIPSNIVINAAVPLAGPAPFVRIGSPTRSIGIASKAFINPYSGDPNYVAAYQSTYQPTYFLMNNSNIPIAKFAYQNGGGYVPYGLPQVNVIGSSASVAYLVKDLVTSVNKGTAVGSNTQLAAIYSQTGVNFATFQFGTSGIRSLEAGGNLHINGGFLSAYDGYTYAEHNFHLYPDSIEVTASSTGAMSAGTYYYQIAYEWTDNTGNVFRSAPSIPVSIVVASGTSACQVNIPMLRLTAKSNVRIGVYRWSTLLQTYYQVTSLTNPLLNDPTVDQIQFNDKLSDAQIIGNNILYTNGAVIEDIGIPACADLTQFDSRAWVISAEDPNLLYFSKPLVESTPVEMSDLQTFFVSPSVGVGGPTGGMKCTFPMDDKLIIFKKNAIYYINGVGPDSTGANNQYSEPIFITSTVGCANKASIVLIPAGIMFQSQKGIWLLGRDLSTQYIGKDVESYNSQTVLSSVAAPATNQVRFDMSGGGSIVYDYFVGQWDQSSAGGVSSTLYNDLHTYIDSSGNCFQETIGQYADGSTAVLMSWTTGWANLSGLQGYQRAYWMDILGNFQSGNTYTIGIAYDYNPAIVQTATILPTNTIGSGSSVEQWQVNFQRQQCQSFQLTFNEISSGSIGAGLTLSGVNLVYGRKKTFPRNIRSANRTG